MLGELRRYSGSWEDIETFYDQRKTLEDGTLLLALPLEIRHRRERTSLAFVDGYSFNPFDADVPSLMQGHYDSRGIPQSLNGTEQNLYLVYSVW